MASVGPIAAPQLLTVGQVADVLQLSRRTVQRLIDVGDLPAVRLGPRSLRVPLERLNEALEHHSTITEVTE